MRMLGKRSDALMKLCLQEPHRQRAAFVISANSNVRIGARNRVARRQRNRQCTCATLEFVAVFSALVSYHQRHLPQWAAKRQMRHASLERSRVVLT